MKHYALKIEFTPGSEFQEETFRTMLELQAHTFKTFVESKHKKNKVTYEMMAVEI